MKPQWLVDLEQTHAADQAAGQIRRGPGLSAEQICLPVEASPSANDQGGLHSTGWPVGEPRAFHARGERSAR
jgi:hypothetical protein